MIPKFCRIGKVKQSQVGRNKRTICSDCSQQDTAGRFCFSFVISGTRCGRGCATELFSSRPGLCFKIDEERIGNL